MASTNDEIPQQSKPRISPLEYRNTDLVSRLLAATPPYLYNMSLVPNTYFFSEMLRSFVQAKAERTSAPLQRRSRKRSWTQSKSSESTSHQGQGQGQGHQNQKTQKLPIPLPLPLAMPIEDAWKPLEVNYYDEHKLSMSTELLNNKEKLYSGPGPGPGPGSGASMFANATSTAAAVLPPTSSASGQGQGQSQGQAAESSSGLILPPPPPIWYPPLYNTPPYGIDPLHFFIDLRVSGHIYDRKKSALEKEESELLGGLGAPAAALKDAPKAGSCFKSSKHASAFSVPTKSHPNHPINLSKAEDGEHKPLRFDVKSLGLESIGHNRTGINYVMNNIERVYKDLHEGEGVEGEAREGREERKKRELKELIGLELAVDYMSQSNKMGIKHHAAGDADAEGMVLEVVDVQDET